MPLLVDNDDGTTVWESDAICRHLLEKHASAGSLYPVDLAQRTNAEVLCRLHDAYIGPIQGCIYKPAPPFGRFGTRRAALQELRDQLAVAESLCAAGPYLTGESFTLADATLFPTLVFIVHVRRHSHARRDGRGSARTLLCSHRVLHLARRPACMLPRRTSQTLDARPDLLRALRVVAFRNPPDATQV